VQYKQHDLLKRAIGKTLLTITKPLSLFDANIALRDYFRLREDVVSQMTWTFSTLHPLITPFILGNRVPGNGTIAAMLQASGFNIIVSRETHDSKYSESFSVVSPCYPERTFPLGVTEAAVLELEGAKSLRVKRYDNMSDVDRSLQNLSTLLRHRLSCELFPDTKVVIERILTEGMLQATTTR